MTIFFFFFFFFFAYCWVIEKPEVPELLLPGRCLKQSHYKWLRHMYFCPVCVGKWEEKYLCGKWPEKYFKVWTSIREYFTHLNIPMKEQRTQRVRAPGTAWASGSQMAPTHTHTHTHRDTHTHTQAISRYYVPRV